MGEYTVIRLEEKYYVITTWGQVLDWDEDKNLVFSRKISKNPPRFHFSTEKNIFSFNQNNDTEFMVFSDGSVGCGEKELIPTKLKINYVGNSYYYFSFNGLYLSSEQNGTTRFCRSKPDNWEKYRLISQEDYKILSNVFSEKWYLPSLNSIGIFNIENSRDGFSFEISGIYLNIDDIIGSCDCPLPKEIIIPHDGWKLEKLVLYKPLVYYCSFGREEGFECLNISIKSLRFYGKYCGDIKIITDRTVKILKEKYDHIIDDNVHILPYKAIDHIDFMSARFDSPLYEEIDNYQPILYLDTDIIISSPIDDLFYDIIKDNTSDISVLKETDHPFSEKYWGRELFEEDSYSKIPDYGFSTGIILYRNNERLKNSFLAVRKTIERQSLIFGHRDIFRCYDQPIANYIMHKFEKTDYRIMEKYACNYDSSKESVEYVEYEKYILSLSVSIVHFCGGVGAYNWKLNAMKKFFDWLNTNKSNNL